MDKEEIKKRILEFLKEHDLCVISTIHVDGSGPESAVVAFTETENLEIVFGTSNTSRKYKNIQNNNNVSLVIGWDSKVGTIQYEGTVSEVSKQESPKYSALHVQKNPDSEKYINQEDQSYFLVSPKWIRFTDNRTSDVYEVDL